MFFPACYVYQTELCMFTFKTALDHMKENTTKPYSMEPTTTKTASQACWQAQHGVLIQASFQALANSLVRSVWMLMCFQGWNIEDELAGRCTKCISFKYFWLVIFQTSMCICIRDNATQSVQLKLLIQKTSSHDKLELNNLGRTRT